MRTRRGLVLVILVTGAGLLAWGTQLPNGAYQSILINLGAAVFLFIPFLWLQSLVVAARDEARVLGREVVRVQQTVADMSGMSDGARAVAATAASDMEAFRQSVDAMVDDAAIFDNDPASVRRLLRNASLTNLTDSLGVIVPIREDDGQEGWQRWYLRVCGYALEDGAVGLTLYEGRRYRVTGDWSPKHPASAVISGMLQKAAQSPGGAQRVPDPGLVVVALEEAVSLVARAYKASSKRWRPLKSVSAPAGATSGWAILGGREVVELEGKRTIYAPDLKPWRSWKPRMRGVPSGVLADARKTVESGVLDSAFRL